MQKKLLENTSKKQATIAHLTGNVACFLLIILWISSFKKLIQL